MPELNGNAEIKQTNVYGGNVSGRALSGVIKSRSTGGGGNPVVIRGTGNYSIVAAETETDHECEASGVYSLALGNTSIASANSAIAMGGRVVNETYGNRATGIASTAIGGASSLASGDYAIAMGYKTTASGSISFALGQSTVASGQASAAFGTGTIANHKSQLVFGRYNIADPSEAAATAVGNYIEIVGNGSSSTRANARTLDWSGNEVLAGKLTVGSAPVNNMDVATKQYVDGMSVPSGGLAGRALVKNSNTNYDASWQRTSLLIHVTDAQ